MARNALKAGYQLHWYIIREVLGQGGFGITYLAEDTNLKHQVAIKEFLPTEMAVRDQDASVQPLSGEHGEEFKWGLERFITEAQTLAKFKHPNIVRVLTVFSDNNTAYMVMEYEHGRPLSHILKERNTLPEPELIRILEPLLNGLEQVHAAGFIHRDIKPANIYLRDDGSPVLLDFGSARQALSHHTRTLTTMVSPGFAPFEQYVSKSDKQGPWTDIYGLGATLYRSVVGKPPVDAMDRSEALLHVQKDIYVPVSEINPAGYSKAFLAAIDRAMSFKTEDRPQSIKAWRESFDSLSITQSVSIQTDTAEASTMINIAAAEDEPSGTVKLETTNQAATITDSTEESLASELPRTSGFMGLVKKLLKWSLILMAILFLLFIWKANRFWQQVGSVNELSAPAVNDSEPVADTPAMEQIEESPPVSQESDNAARIQQLLAAAHADIQALRLTSPLGNNAVSKFRDVLYLDPDNQAARTGLDQVVDKYLQLMDNSLQNDDLEMAKNYLHKATSVVPGHPDIARASGRLARYEQQQRQTDTSKELAKSDTQELITDQQKSRIRELKDLLDKNPRDVSVRRELSRQLTALQTKVREALASGDLSAAETMVKQALEITPDNRKLRKALKQIEDAKKKIRDN